MKTWKAKCSLWKIKFEKAKKKKKKQPPPGIIDKIGVSTGATFAPYRKHESLFQYPSFFAPHI